MTYFGPDQEKQVIHPVKLTLALQEKHHDEHVDVECSGVCTEHTLPSVQSNLKTFRPQCDEELQQVSRSGQDHREDDGGACQPPVERPHVVRV